MSSARDIATEPTAEAAVLRSASGRPLQKNWLSIISIIWVGQAVSIITSYAAGYAMVWWLTETTASAWMLAVGTICAMLPQGLLSPFGGVIADRFNRKTVMIVADMSVGIVSLICAFIIIAGGMSIPLILVLAAVRAVGSAFHSPAMMATMPMLVPEKHLMRINSLDQLLASIASIGAPAFGIFLYTTLGFQSVMFLDFAGACVAVLGLMLAKVPTVTDELDEEKKVFAHLAEGWRALSSTPGLVLVLAGATMGMMVFGPLSAIFPLMTYSYFGGDGYMAAIADGAFGVGMIVGSLIIMAWGGGRRLVRLVCVSALMTGGFTAACGFVPPDMFWLFVVLVAFMAVSCAWFSAPCMTLVQTNTPEEKNGRALGLFMAAIGIASPLGVAAGGALAEVIGVAPFFVIDGLACIVLGVAVYLMPNARALDRTTAAARRSAEDTTESEAAASDSEAR